MSRLASSVLIAVALVACAGIPPATRPLFIARAVDTTPPAPSEARLEVERNSIRFLAPASIVTGCFELVGEYVREGSRIEVGLRQVAATTPCTPDDHRPYITRIGPLSPGWYEVSVTLDGKLLIRSERLGIT